MLLKTFDAYKLFNRLPKRLKYCLECSFGTWLNERIWAGRKLSSGIDYHGAEIDMHRLFLMKHLSFFNPINTVLEVGCGAGLNLYLLSKKYPDAELKGVDININSVQYGNRYFKKNGIINVELIYGKADDLSQFQDNYFDVVFTDATLIYIGPDKIKNVMGEILRVASKGIVFLEWDSFDDRYIGHWVRSYRELLNSFLPDGCVQTSRLPSGFFNGDKNWGRYGTVIRMMIT